MELYQQSFVNVTIGKNGKISFSTRYAKGKLEKRREKFPRTSRPNSRGTGILLPLAPASPSYATMTQSSVLLLSWRNPTCSSLVVFILGFSETRSRGRVKLSSSLLRPAPRRIIAKTLQLFAR